VTITRFRTNANGDRRTSASPRITDAVLARHPAATRAPEPHTSAELDALIGLLHGARATTIAIGHGRHSASIATASAIADAWPGIVTATVDWPANAASWLRPARRLVSGEPDAWVVADTPAGSAQLIARLVEQPGWTPMRTFGTASLDSPELAELSGPGVLTGMRGATAAGHTWRIDDDTLTHDSIAKAYR
jgi:hypothetical protein